MPEKSHYEILGVSPRATTTEIKTAFRLLARQYHPDASQDENSAAVFQRIQEAYQVLSDSNRRKEYDFLHPELTAEQKEAVDTYERVQDSTKRTADARPWPQFDFQSGENSGYQGPAATKFRTDEAVAEAEPEDSLLGRLKRKLKKPDPIDTSDRHFEKIASYQGAPKVSATAPPPPINARSREFHFTIDALESLKGTSREIAISDGDSPRLIRVKIPAGVLDGANLKVNIGVDDTVSVRIRVVPHALIDRVGNDIILNLPITIVEAAYGGEIFVPTLSGPVLVKIPPKTSDDKKLRVKGRGFKNELEGTQGDLYVRTIVMMPDYLPPHVEEMLRSLSAAYTQDVRKNVPSTL